MQHNRRAAACRNYSVRQSSGTYIAFIDQDDIWLKDKLLWQVEYLRKTGFDAVHGNLMYVDETGKFIQEEICEQENEARRNIKWDILSKEELIKNILAYPNIRLISSMIKREVFLRIGGFKEQFFGGEDEIFWFDLVRLGTIGYLDKILFYRTIHEMNTSSYYSLPRTTGYIKALKFIKPLTEKKYLKIIDKKIKLKYYSLIGVSWKMKKYSLFIKSFLALICFDPIFLFSNYLTQLRKNKL
jgi:glycosyltransferase involved in cell wall biosynthesis